MLLNLSVFFYVLLLCSCFTVLCHQGKFLCICVHSVTLKSVSLTVKTHIWIDHNHCLGILCERRTFSVLLLSPEIGYTNVSITTFDHMKDVKDYNQEVKQDVNM